NVRLKCPNDKIASDAGFAVCLRLGNQQSREPFISDHNKALIDGAVLLLKHGCLATLLRSIKHQLRKAVVRTDKEENVFSGMNQFAHSSSFARGSLFNLG